VVTVALARRSGDDGGVVDGNGGWRRGASSAAAASSDDGDDAYEKGFAILCRTCGGRSGKGGGCSRW